jgi:caffeoyl-CoA O-methyltransferase
MNTNPTTDITLYGYYRSSCSHRLQIGLRIKQIPFKYVSVNLDKREQETPVLIIGEQVYTHTFAILELLDELFPDSGLPLLPSEPMARARAREISQAVACLMQPFQLPWSIRKRMIEPFHLDKHPLGIDGACRAFTTKQLTAMMVELNRLVGRSSSTFSVGDTLSIADCAVIPQLVAASSFGIDVNAYGALSKVFENCSKLPLFKAAHPLALPDAPDNTSHLTEPDSAISNSEQESISLMESTMAYKEADAITSRYLTNHANAIVPQMEFVREEAFRLHGPVATKMSARDVCFFLRWMADKMRAKTVIEVGIFTGSSSLALLDGMPNEGRLIAFDISEEYTAIAKEAWKRQGWTHRVDLRITDATDGLKDIYNDSSIAGYVDLAYIDGPNTEYLKHYELLLPLMRPGGVIVFDNVLWKGQVARPCISDDSQTIHLRKLTGFLKDDPRIESCVIALGDGLALATKK